MPDDRPARLKAAEAAFAACSLERPDEVQAAMYELLAAWEEYNRSNPLDPAALEDLPVRRRRWL